jgi:NADH-quinone oxidoreductase subunit H
MTSQVPFLTFLLISVVKLLVVFVITLTAVAYTVLLERKLLGRMQNRWGPSRTGPFGLLQPLADGIKLFLKEDLTPLAVDRPLFLVAPMIALACAMTSSAVVPFGAIYTVFRWSASSSAPGHSTCAISSPPNPPTVRSPGTSSAASRSLPS